MLARVYHRSRGDKIAVTKQSDSRVVSGERPLEDKEDIVFVCQYYVAQLIFDENILCKKEDRIGRFGY